MCFQDLPLFSTSVKTIIYWSLIVDKNWRRYVAFISIILLNVSQFANAFLTDEPIDAVIREAYFVALWLNTFIRTTVLAYNRRRFEEFLTEVNIAYKNIQRNEDDKMNRMLADTSKSASAVARLNFIMGFLASVGFLSYPLIAGIRALPYAVHIPGVDKYASPWYEILYTFQFLVTIPGCCIFISFANLLVAFIKFGIMMHKVLRNHLSQLKDLKQEQIHPEVMWCIRYHLQIIRYVENVNFFITYNYLAEFLTSGALLCALLFQLNMAAGLVQMMVVLGYIIITGIQISGMYYFANELYYQSVEVAFEAYNTDWFDFDLRTQKALLMLIVRTRKPCAILLGNVYPVTLELFQSLLRTTYSYFTFLRGFYE